MNQLHDHLSLSEHLPALELHSNQHSIGWKWMEMVKFFTQSCNLKRRLHFPPDVFFLLIYTFSHSHGSVEWLHLKGNYYWRDPFFTSMTMGGRVLDGGFKTLLFNYPESWGR